MQFSVWLHEIRSIFLAAFEMIQSIFKASLDWRYLHNYLTVYSLCNLDFLRILQDYL